MMLRLAKGLVTICLFAVSVAHAQPAKRVTSHVNPFIGTYPLTDSAILGYHLPKGWRSWAGLVFPGSSVPNAMVQLSPMTEYGSGAGYEYEDERILSFTHTNKGHWNLCNIPILPLTEGTAPYSSRYSHKNEKASPAYYQVFLEDYKINVQLTSTLRCGFHKYEYSGNTNRKVFFDLTKANNNIRRWAINQDGNNAVKGFQQAGREKIFFYAIISAPIQKMDTTGLVYLADGGANTVDLRIGLSFVSEENARQNLAQEIGNKSFDDIHRAGENEWETVLGKIKLKGGTEKQKELFYSSFYRSLLWPALRSDVNGEYTDAKNNVVKADFNYYTIPSLWDTYRNKDVLLGIVSPTVTLNVIRSMKDIGDKTGFIPTFFHGDHAASSITGAYLRGITDFDVKGTYELLLRNANVEGGSRPFISEYIKKGYISDPKVDSPHVETKARAGVSKTLEYAYDDYSVAQLAKKLGDTANYRILMQRSKNYRNVFDPSTKFMRGRLENGDWITPFNPEYPYYEYMYREANGWQVSFFAPHDMKGLVALYGGPKQFEAKLDTFFTKPWNANYIARNVETMVGQYCHGNQPDHEAPFAYYWVGKPWKSQQKLDYIMNNLYGIGPEGLALSGMDDAGEMSAWYVFTALGLYTFSATDPEYLVTVPLFDEVHWTQNNGKVLTIKKAGASRNLSGILVNNKKQTGYFVPHDLFKNGGVITVQTK